MVQHMFVLRECWENTLVIVILEMRQVVDDVVAGISRSDTTMEPPPDDAVPTEYHAETC